MLKDTSVQLKVQGSEEVTVGLLTSRLPVDNVIASAQVALTDGVGANKAQKVGSMSTVLASGASFTFDLRVFSGQGGNIAFGKAKALIFINSGIIEGDTIVWGNDGAVANFFDAPFLGANPRLVQPKDGFMVLATGSAGGWLVDATHRNIKATNTGTNNVVIGLTVIGEL